MENLATTLGKELALDGEVKTVGSPSLSLTVSKNRAAKLDNKQIKSPSGNTVGMPKISDLVGRPDTAITAKVIPLLSISQESSFS